MRDLVQFSAIHVSEPIGVQAENLDNVGILPAPRRGGPKKVRAAPLGLLACAGRLPRVTQMLAELALASPWAVIGLCLRHGRVRNKTEPS